MLNKYVLYFFCLAGLLLTGCATPTRMAFYDNPNEKPNSDKVVCLLSVTLKNSYRTSFQPKLTVAHVERGAAAEHADRINFTVDNLAKMEDNNAAKGNSYLLRFELDKGEYDIRGMSAMAQALIVNGFYFVPVHQRINAKYPGCYYLGHIEAIVRERKDNEFKAGPIIPLIDQAVTGASGGTFDVEISDQWGSDEAKFLEKIPGLKNVEVKKSILPPFDRAVAQKWWETH